jgi:hypothetical protein
MAGKKMSIRRDTSPTGKSAKTSVAKSQTETTKLITDVVALQRFKDLMKKNAGKLKFSGSDK